MDDSNLSINFRNNIPHFHKAKLQEWQLHDEAPFYIKLKQHGGGYCTYARLNCDEWVKYIAPKYMEEYMGIENCIIIGLTNRMPDEYIEAMLSNRTANGKRLISQAFKISDELYLRVRYPISSFRYKLVYTGGSFEYDLINTPTAIRNALLPLISQRIKNSKVKIPTKIKQNFISLNFTPGRITYFPKLIEILLFCIKHKIDIR